MPNWSTPRRALFCLGALVSLAGCGAATDDRPARWSFISTAIIQPSCATASCHSEIAQRAGVDLHDRPTGYRMMIERNFAVPGIAGDPKTAALPRLLRAEGAPRMPPDFALPIEDIELIEKWIAEGAMNN